MEASKEIYLERQITAPDELQTIREKISKWFESKFGETSFKNIVVNTALSRPSYKVSVSFEYQKREIKKEQKPYEGEKIVPLQTVVKDSDIWGIALEGTGTFEEKHERCLVARDIDKCHNCHGDRYISCECSEGEIFCRKCEGSGKVKCSDCDGAGTVRCKKCLPFGQKDCTICRGTGKVDCPSCKDGYVTCPKCKGGKKVRCTTCEGKSKFTCNLCSGSGSLVTESRIEYRVKPLIRTDVAHHPNFPHEDIDSCKAWKDTSISQEKKPNNLIYLEQVTTNQTLENFPSGLKNVITNLKNVITKLIDENNSHGDAFLQDGYRIFARKTSIEPIMVMYVQYQYLGNQYSLWLYGEDEVWDLDSPIRTKQEKILEEGKAALESKAINDDEKALQKLEKVNHPGLEKKKNHLAAKLEINIKWPYLLGALPGGIVGGLIYGIIQQSLGYSIAIGFALGLLFGISFPTILLENVTEFQKKFWASFLIALLVGMSGKIILGIVCIILFLIVTGICKNFSKKKSEKTTASGFVSTIGNVLILMLGLLLVFLGLLVIYNHLIIGGLVFFIMAMVLLPPLNKNLPISTKIAILIIGWAIFASSVQNLDAKSTITKQAPAVQQQNK